MGKSQEEFHSISIVTGSEGEEIMTSKAKITIIGGGVGGYPAAIRAARMGADVTLIENDAIGGTCLNWGCIPTKTLLQSANVIRTVKNSEMFGIKCRGLEVDFDAIMARKNTVVNILVKGVRSLLLAKKIKIVNGTATLVDPKTVEVKETGEKISSDYILIATGSKPGKILIGGIDGPDVMDSTQFLSMKSLPKSAVIIGGGVIGVEFGQFLNVVGTKVTIIELMPNLIPGLDKEIAVLLEKLIVNSGIEIITNAKIKGIDHKKTENVVTYSVKEQTKTVSAEKVLLTVGRKPDCSLLNIDKLGIKRERDAIVVDEYMQTNVPGVYAVGDVIGGCMLAHVATAEGECAVKNMLGQRLKMDYRAVPSCIYTSPEVASVGLTEEQARESCQIIEVGKFPFRGNGKALLLNETDGMVKILSDKKYGEILGVHIIGPHATDMIAEAVLAINLEATVEELAHTIHPHPTVSEAIMEAALTLTGGAIHMP
jgi:dihydrolipoamide dehydrogenase